jgi:hypothetical protein
MHVPTLAVDPAGSREFLMEYFATAGINVKPPNQFDTGGQFAGRAGSFGQPVRAPLEYVGDRAVYDGQTFVFGGDFPELPQDPAEIESAELDRSLLVFLTPTIVDADGNRVHPPDRLPYDSNSIPPQNVR